MMYLFYGNDTKKARFKARAFINTIRGKLPMIHYEEADTDTFKAERFEELLLSQGLFDEHAVIFSSRLSESEEALEYIEKNAKKMAESKNVFIFFEENLSKAILAFFKKHSEKVWEFGKKEEKRAESPSAFRITDAIGRKDKKSAWMFYTEALLNGEDGEKLHGLVFWQIKTLFMIKGAETLGEVELASLPFKSFVLMKNKGFSKNYTHDELIRLLDELVSLYHEAHRGGVPIDLLLERWILKI